MKLLLVVLVAVVAHQACGQNFENHAQMLLAVQEFTEAGHQFMERSFDNARVQMSDKMRVLNREALVHLLAGLEVVLAMRNETEDLLANKGKINLCIRKVGRDFENQLEQVGLNISSCASNADFTVQQLTDDMFTLLEEVQSNSTRLQHRVLSAFDGWNPMEDPMFIYHKLENEFMQTQDDFFTNIVPLIEANLVQVFDATERIPVEMELCVAAAIDQLEESFKLTKETVLNC